LSLARRFTTRLSQVGDEEVIDHCSGLALVGCCGSWLPLRLGQLGGLGLVPDCRILDSVEPIARIAPLPSPSRQPILLYSEMKFIFSRVISV